MKKISLVFILMFISFGTVFAQNEARLMRFPSSYGKQIVFTYAGDLYTVSKSGGVARKLTSDVGYEMFARFSPDGKNLAFTAQYDGNTEVFLLPSKGGVPKRLTYTATLSRDDISDRMGPNNIVLGWRDNENIVFRSRKKSFNSFKGQLFLASVNGGLPEELPLPCGGFCSYSPDKTKLAYNRVFREFRTWKYYRGGMADDIWIYDFNTKETVNITNNLAQDIIPMWYGNTIYFISDRDRIMNLFSYNIDTKETKKLTNYTKYDIKFPSPGNKCIVYENGGYIYAFDLSTQKAEKIHIQIANDFLSSRPKLKDASKYINTYSTSPDGKRLAFGARGDVFTVPAKKGITRNLTRTAGKHDRNVEWSPDGKYIAFISDKTGEDEIYIISQDGSTKPVRLTDNSDTYKYSINWSPDSKKILWSDKMQRLQYVNINTKEVTQVDETRDGEFRGYNWSPDSKWICYPRPDNTTQTKIYIYNIESKEKHAITDGWYNSKSPVFSDNGKYLFFISLRTFNPTYSWNEWNYSYSNMMKIYFITLEKSTPSPFKQENDEVTLKENNDEEKKEETSEDKDIKIDFEGISNRVIELPGKAGIYWNINPVGNSVYYCKKTPPDNESQMMMYDLTKQKETKLSDNTNYEISANKKKMTISNDGQYAVIDLPESLVKLKDYVDLSNMKLWIDPKEEWQQIYTEAWRQMRDFFYDPNMHGVDWKSIYSKYNPLVPFVNNRNDLNYIIGEMIGELNVGHAYVSGGDKISPKRINTGLLGAELIKDSLSGYFKIVRILKGENWNSAHRSPLTEIGVDINEGDYILAVNGIPTNNVKNLYELLVNTANKQVELTVNPTTSVEGSRDVIIVPISDESKLYYYNWVQNNIKKVNEATNGKVGYIHIPDMMAAGLNEFIKHFYPQLRKKALIIDVRGNGGGNVSPMIIERLSRELSLMKVARNQSQTTQPGAMILGPKVCLIDQYSASDGDLFPYQFKKHKLGKLIGMRTWGGVVGIRGSLQFIDGGSLNKPEFAHYNVQGTEFIIEGHGVDPDIVIDNDPAKEYAGEDEQLNKAIEIILEDMKNYPDELPPIPQYPEKSREDIK